MNRIADAVRIAARLVALAAWMLACLASIMVWPIAPRRRRWSGRFLRIAARLAGVRVRLHGALAPTPRLLLANHLSWLDILILGGAAGSAFVARDSLTEIATLHWLCRFNDTVFVAREDRGSITDQIAQLRAAIVHDSSLTLFPEGGTGDGIALRPFKSALFAALATPPAGHAIQPVLIDYGANARAIAWCGDEHGIRNFLRILARQHRLDVTLRFLTPLTPAETATRKTIAEAARSRIEAAIAAGDQRVAL